jgi:hypothetical protein
VARRSLVLVCARAAAARAPGRGGGARAGAPGAPPRIAFGVSAGGVDLSGLTVRAAAARLDAALLPALKATLFLTVSGRTYHLTTRRAGLRLNSRRTARRALAARPGVASVPLALTHSRRVVRAFAERVARRVGHPARDARLRITLRRLLRRPGRPGRALPLTATARRIDAALADPRAPRLLRARLVTVRPRIRARDLPRVYRAVLTVDRRRFRLRLFKRLRLRRKFPIAVGMAGLATPRGLYAVTSKQVNPAWHVPLSPWAGALGGQVIPGGAPNNPLKARWLGLADGIGIHGTAEDWSIGKRASHGCIRMHVRDVKALYRQVPLGTPVLIR